MLYLFIIIVYENAIWSKIYYIKFYKYKTEMKTKTFLFQTNIKNKRRNSCIIYLSSLLPMGFGNGSFDFRAYFHRFNFAYFYRKLRTKE